MSDTLGAAAIDTTRAFAALLRTAVLFQLEGRPAVARAVRKVIGAPAPAPAQTVMQRAAVWRAYRAVQRVRRFWPAEVKCLQTALILDHVLRARGIPTSLHIGARIDGGTLVAHAWIEAGGFRLEGAPGAGPELATLRSRHQRAGLVSP